MILADLLQMDMGSDRLELAYFWAGALIAIPPTALFGWIGFLAVRGYFRDQARKSTPVIRPSAPER